MGGIVINIDPVIAELGGFELRWYSVFITLAIGVALFIAVREGKRKGIPPGVIYSGASWIIAGGLVGARLFHVLDNLGYYVNNPAQIIHFQGLAIWGGLVGGGVAAFIYARVKRIPISRAADVAVIALLAAQIIGRLGCIINGDAYGGITALPWGFIYTNPNSMIPDSLAGLPTHPYPLYEILWNSIVLLLLLRLRHHFKTDGMLFLTYISLYAIGRFVLSFVRQENTVLWNLQQAQVIAIGIAISAVIMVIYLVRKSRHAANRELQHEYIDY